MIAGMMGLYFLPLLAGPQPGHLAGQAFLPRDRAAREAVVTLEGAEKAQPITGAVVDQRDKLFAPHVSIITVGTTVSFPNNDTVFHNVFAYFNAKKFDLGVYPRGSTKKVRFDKTGIVALLCNVHSEMSAYIYVADTPYYAVTDRQGRFDIRNVPPGTYTLRAWHESGAVLTETVTVSAGSGAATLKLKRG